MNFLTSNDLQDVWRTLYPNTVDYTYFSHSQNSYSRIDYIFISRKYLDRVLSSQIHDIVISDHAIVTCTISPKENSTSHRIWRMNRKFLADTDFLKYINGHIDLFLETNVNLGDPKDRPEIHIVWDSFKAYIRGVMIGYSLRKKAELDKKLSKIRGDKRITKST